jgi:hypothetical protein
MDDLRTLQLPPPGRPPQAEVISLDSDNEEDDDDLPVGDRDVLFAEIVSRAVGPSLTHSPPLSCGHTHAVKP